MTRDKILAIEAGTELDTLIAKKVMGWCKGRRFWLPYPAYDNLYGTGYTVPGYYDYDIPPFRPSTDITAAWEVVESARNDFSHPFLMSVETRASCYVVLARWVDETGETTWVNASADSAPLAICRAALLAVMEADDG
jgi:hypothetical protein